MGANKSVDTIITDETVPTTPDSQTALVNITGPSDVTEGDATTPYTVSITQAPVTDLEVFFTYTGVAKDGTDFNRVVYVKSVEVEGRGIITKKKLDDNLAKE